jgi:competence protein ComEC
MRAWLTILIVLLGDLLEKKPNPLNSLGLALIIIFIFDPLMCRTVGFQLSFISTASILFFFSDCDHLLQCMWIKRPLSSVIEMNHLNKHGFIILTFFRKAVALTIAVNIAMIPMMLYYFQKFPLMGLIYGLFFPFLVSLSILMLLLGMFVQLFCPFLAQILHTTNEHFTKFMLSFTLNMPSFVDVFVRIKPFSETYIISYFSLLLILAIFSNHYLEKHHQEEKALHYL